MGNAGLIRRIRLGVDFHVWDGIFQGSRSHLLGLYRAAIRRAPEVDFVLFLDDTASLRNAYEEFARPNVQLVHMPSRPALVRLAVQLPWLQWRHRLDILHMQYRLPFIRFGDCACTIHDLLFETHPQYFKKSFVWQSKLSYRMACRRAALLFAVSQFSKGEIERLYGIPGERIAVTYNGVDRSRFFPGPAGAEDVAALGLRIGDYILTVGRLEPRKNHVTLLRAYAMLGPQAPELVIVGQRDFQYGDVWSVMESLGIKDRVRVLESVEDRSLPALLRHARLFVYPAQAEGFGMPIAEAMASGVPVVSSNTTSMPEVAGPGALLVDPSNEGQLTDAMARILNDVDVGAGLVRAGLPYVKKFDWDGSAAVLLSAVQARFGARSV